MNQPIVSFDQWRDLYDTWTFTQHQTYNAELARRYPEQRSWNADACYRFLRERAPGSVVEIGGWDGALAKLMLELLPGIETWVNYDITPDVPQVCNYPRYERVVLQDWPWNRSARGDVLIASHVLEHMKAAEIDCLLAAWDVDSLYIDVPIGVEAISWDGYGGTHILDIGANDLLKRLLAAGYRTSHTEGHLILFCDRVRP